MLTRCRICNKMLTNEKSVARQLGTKCYQKWKKGYRGIQVKQSESVRDIANRLNKVAVDACE